MDRGEVRQFAPFWKVNGFVLALFDDCLFSSCLIIACGCEYSVGREKWDRGRGFLQCIFDGELLCFSTFCRVFFLLWLSDDYKHSRSLREGMGETKGTWNGGMITKGAKTSFIIILLKFEGLFNFSLVSSLGYFCCLTISTQNPVGTGEWPREATMSLFQHLFLDGDIIVSPPPFPTPFL